MAGRDPFDFALLEEFLHAVDLPAYAVPGLQDRPRPGMPAGEIARRLKAMGVRAWATPWQSSPAEGVRFVGLDTGVPGAEAATRIEAQVPFLTGVIDRFPDEALFVLLHRPPRLRGTGTSGTRPPFESEMVRFILEAAPNVKMVLSSAPSDAFVRNHAGLLYVGTPPLSRDPHAFQEVTVVGAGAVFRKRYAAPGSGREDEGKRAVHPLR